MDLGGSTASDTDGMTFARRPDAVLTAVGDLHRHLLLTMDIQRRVVCTKHLPW